MNLSEIIKKYRVAVVIFILVLCGITSFLLSRVQIILNLDTDVIISDKLKNEFL